MTKLTYYPKISIGTSTNETTYKSTFVNCNVCTQRCFILKHASVAMTNLCGSH
jgi:hypothetical protein